VAKEIFAAGQTPLNDSFTLRREDREERQIPFGNDNNKGKGNDKNKGKGNRRSLRDDNPKTRRRQSGI
jgi:hypothetical protein